LSGKEKDVAWILCRFNLNTPVGGHEYFPDGAVLVFVVGLLNRDGVVEDAIIESLEWDGCEGCEVLVVVSN